MALSVIPTGSGVAHATAPTVEYIASPAAGDYLIIGMIHKYPANAIATPDGWTLLPNAAVTGGAGASGEDSGEVRVTAFIKVATGSETGSVALAVTGGNIAIGRMLAVRSSTPSTKYLVGVAANGSDNVAGTAYSITTGQNLDLASGDVVVTISGMNEGAGVTFTPYTFAETGITFGSRTQRVSVQSTGGHNARIQIVSADVSAGTADLPFTYDTTGSATLNNYPAGATVVIRVRELDIPLSVGGAAMAIMTGICI